MKDKVIFLKSIISREICDFLALEYEMMQNVCEKLYPGANLADLCDFSFARYSPLMFEALSVKLTPVIEQAVGKKIFPTYSYARIYYNGSELQKHFDRPSSEFTLSICIKKDEVSWPLNIKKSTGEILSYDLDEGDAIIYSGRENEHWRDPFPGTKQIQAFLQYVDAEGDSSWLKWDTRPALGLPFEFADQSVQNEIKRIASVGDMLRITGYEE